MAVLGMAVAAAGSNSDSCDAHPGSTLLEDGGARVFSSGGLISACARPDGSVHHLSHPGSNSTKEVVSHITLAGAFVAWKRLTVHESLGRSQHALGLLDLKSGDSRTVVATYGEPHHPSKYSLADFVLNEGGTLVWLVNFAACNARCDATSKLSESRLGQPNSVLAQDTESGPPGGPNPNPPISSVGLSRSGGVAYWLTRGNARSHRIP